MNKQTTIPLAENLIKAREALRLVAYMDVANNPTIGWGATTIDGRKVNMRDTCTEAQSDMWLRDTGVIRDAFFSRNQIGINFDNLKICC